VCKKLIRNQNKDETSEQFKQAEAVKQAANGDEMHL
jgi:hypothetical protein